MASAQTRFVLSCLALVVRMQGNRQGDALGKRAVTGTELARVGRKHWQLNAVRFDPRARSSSRHNERALIGRSLRSGVNWNNIGCLATLLSSHIRSTEVLVLSFTHIPMALRTPLTRAARRATSTATATPAFTAYSAQWRRGNATVAPVTQSTGPKKGTAMVFMNMGGPSTTDEVGGFLSALFVCWTRRHHSTRD